MSIIFPPRRLVAFGLALISSVPAAFAVATITIQPEDQPLITEWGIATMNRPDWGKNWTVSGHPESLEAVYKELGATIARFHIDYRVGEPNARQREDLKQGILAATEKGLKWYGLPWSPPVEFKTINSPNGKVNGELNRLKPGSEDAVAQWLVDLVKWLAAEGVPLPVGIGVQNESDFGPPSYPGCIYTAEQMQTAVVTLRKKLDEAGLQKVKVIADDGAKEGDNLYPDNVQKPNSGTVNMLGLRPGGAFETNEAFRNALGIIATHTYDLHNQYFSARPGLMEEFYAATRGTGKEVWMTEWETVETHTHSDWAILTEQLTHFNRDMSSMGFNGWFHWHVWRGELLGDGTNDPGDCIGRIRPGDELIFQTKVGDAPKSLQIRYSSGSNLMTLKVYAGEGDSAPIAEMLLPQTTSKVQNFHTLDIPLQDVTGNQKITFKFSAPEAWREAALNWFQFEGQRKVEAESLIDKKTTEKWSSSIIPSYVSGGRAFFIHDDGTTLQRRPLFYLYKKIWNAAPAGKTTRLRRVRSDDGSFRGESKQAIPESYRQDLSAFVSDEKMTVVVVNRNDTDKPVRLTGLTGTSAQVFRYREPDATSIDRDMENVGEFPIADGATEGLLLPAQSINIVITNAGAKSESGESAMNSGPRFPPADDYVPPAPQTPQKAAGDVEQSAKAISVTGGVVPLTAFALDNRTELGEIKGLGPVIQTNGDHPVGVAAVTYSGESGPRSIKVILIDGLGSSYVKLYRNQDEIVVWEMTHNDESQHEYEREIELTTGDQIRVKLSGSEKLHEFEIGPE